MAPTKVAENRARVCECRWTSYPVADAEPGAYVVNWVTPTRCSRCGEPLPDPEPGFVYDSSRTRREQRGVSGAVIPGREPPRLGPPRRRR